VLSFFGPPPEAPRNYRKCVEQGVALRKRPELVGGGLIRRMGGWFEVVALRRSGTKEASDQRIRGDGEFVGQVVEEMDDRGRANVRLTTRRMDLAVVSEKVCGVHVVNPGELRSGSRRDEIVKARRVFSVPAVKELGYSVAAGARYLGVTNSCVTKAVSADEAPEKENSI